MSVTVNVARIGNLFYQLECLAGRLRCSEQAYREHWTKLGFGGAGDAAMLDRFAQTLDVYATRALLRSRDDADTEQVSPFGPEIVDMGPRSTDSLHLLSRIRLAAYGSADRDSLQARLGLLMQPRDVAAIGTVVEHFLPRFDRWWSAGKVTDSLDRFSGELQHLLVTGTAGFIGQVANFYGFENAASHGPIVIHLIAHPLEQAPTNGTAIENHAVLEVLKDEPAEQRVGVMVHEIAHHFFAIASEEFHQERLEGALRAGDPRAPAALALSRLLRTTSLYESTLATGDSLADSVLFRHPYLNGIVLMGVEDRAAFADLVPGIEAIRTRGSEDTVSCTVRRDSGAVLYVVVTDRAGLDSTELVSTLERASRCP
jgi:hypothetical protein